MTSEKVKSLAREAHGNIYPNSDAYTFERGYIHGYEDALDKACEWLKEHAFSWVDDNKVNEATRKLKQQKIKELQDNFRKAIEE